jgi:hypothetical protein
VDLQRFRRTYPRYRRVLLGVALALASAGLAAWAFASGLPHDNDRFIHSLHATHQSRIYRESLARVNRGLPPEEQLDQCSVCHARRGPLGKLAAPVSMQDSDCGWCHDTREQHPVGTAFEASFAVPQAPGRSLRTAHSRRALVNDRGLRYDPSIQAALPIACADCHPDHRGSDFMTKNESLKLPGDVKHPRRMWISLQEQCLGCHVPDRPSREGDPVLSRFLEKHSGKFVNRDFSDNLGRVLARRARLSDSQASARLGQLKADFL